MKTSEAIEYFGSRLGIARALGIKQPSVQAWKEFPPDDRQIQIHALTKGRLQAEPEVRRKLLELAKAVR